MMQARLIVFGVVVLAFMGLGLVAYHYKVAALDAQTAERAATAKLKTAEDVNKANQATIGRLQAQAANDAKLTAQLAENIAAANQAVIENNAALAALKDANEDVRKFMALPVPPELRKLYDRPRAGSGH